MDNYPVDAEFSVSNGHLSLALLVTAELLTESWPLRIDTADTLTFYILNTGGLAGLTLYPRGHQAVGELRKWSLSLSPARSQPSSETAVTSNEKTFQEISASFNLRSIS